MTITIKTTRFGDIEVEDNRIIRFIEPLLGFESLSEFVILDHADSSPFKWLQSVEEPDLAFVITNPKLFGIDYEFVLPAEAAQRLEVTQAEDVLVATIVNIPEGEPSRMTANLLGPVVINEKQRTAMQVVLADTEYTTRTRLISDDVLERSSRASIAAPDRGD